MRAQQWVTERTVFSQIEKTSEGKRDSFHIRYGVGGADHREANVGQATKGTRGIPWHQQPKKDVVDHDRPGEAVNRR